MFEVSEENVVQLQSKFKRWRNVAVVDLDDRYYSYKMLRDIEKLMKKVKEYSVEIIQPYTLRIEYKTKLGKGYIDIYELNDFPPEHVVKGTWKEGTLKFEVGCF